MARKLTLVAMMLLIASAAMAQAPAVGGAVGPQLLDTVNVPNIPAMQVPPIAPQDYNVPGSVPTSGKYDILVNAWIEAYARVSAYDNWIDFGIMAPTSGTWASPVSRWAFSETTGHDYALDGEVGGQSGLYNVGGDTSSTEFDLAGIQIQTNARLDLAMNMGGYMSRVNENGYLYTGQDTRKSPLGPYQLRNQVKMCLRGKFLNWASASDPALDDAGTAYTSMTSGQPTTYGTAAGTGWTQWDPAVTVGGIYTNTGWFEPTTSEIDPWSGGGFPPSAPRADRGTLGALNLVVERGQAQDSGTGDAAELWFTQRILRRGLQDVAGNYRSDMNLTLTYREADAQWQPEM